MVSKQDMFAGVARGGYIEATFPIEDATDVAPCGPIVVHLTSGLTQILVSQVCREREGLPSLLRNGI